MPLCKQFRGGETDAFLLLFRAMTFHEPADIPHLRGPVPLSHLLIRQFVRNGDRVIDATCGNGHDTLLLAKLVGPAGSVWAFDIQKQAMEATAARLANAGSFPGTKLVHASHESMKEKCPDMVNAVVFNLGFLPGGDHALVTRPESTLSGIDQALTLLAPAGIIAISIYPGHDGGSCEQAAVESRLTQLAPHEYHVWRMAQMNVPAGAPYFVLIQKAA